MTATISPTPAPCKTDRVAARPMMAVAIESVPTSPKRFRRRRSTRAAMNLSSARSMSESAPSSPAARMGAVTAMRRISRFMARARSGWTTNTLETPVSWSRNTSTSSPCRATGRACTTSLKCRSATTRHHGTPNKADGTANSAMGDERPGSHACHEDRARRDERQGYGHPELRPDVVPRSAPSNAVCGELLRRHLPPPDMAHRSLVPPLESRGRMHRCTREGRRSGTPVPRRWSLERARRRPPMGCRPIGDPARQSSTSRGRRARRAGGL